MMQKTAIHLIAKEIHITKIKKGPIHAEAAVRNMVKKLIHCLIKYTITI